MTPEFRAILGVGVRLGLGMLRLFSRLDVRIDRLDDHVRSQGERLARLEGKSTRATFGKPEATS